MNLGQPARKAIKGDNLDYYLNALDESRKKTLAELKKRDDKWLAALDTEAGMNNLHSVIPSPPAETGKARNLS